MIFIFSEIYSYKIDIPVIVILQDEIFQVFTLLHAHKGIFGQRCFRNLRLKSHWVFVKTIFIPQLCFYLYCCLSYYVIHTYFPFFLFIVKHLIKNLKLESDKMIRKLRASRKIYTN